MIKNWVWLTIWGLSSWFKKGKLFWRKLCYHLSHVKCILLPDLGKEFIKGNERRRWGIGKLLKMIIPSRKKKICLLPYSAIDEFGFRRGWKLLRTSARLVLFKLEQKQTFSISNIFLTWYFYSKLISTCLSLMKVLAYLAFKINFNLNKN